MKTYMMKAVLACSLVAGVGCGNKSPGQAATDLKNQITGQSNQTRNQLGLSSDWNSPCAPKGPIPGFKGMKEQYHFGDDGRFTKKFFTYDDEQCQTEAFVRVEDGTYSPQGSSTPKEGVQVNFNFKTVTIVPSTDIGTKALNSIHYCGVTNYATHQASDVTAHSGDLLCVGVTQSPRDTFDFVKLLDDHTLALGDDANQKDEGSRPTTVDPSLVFKN